EIVGPIDAALERLGAASDGTPRVAREEIDAFRDVFASRIRGSVKGLTAQDVLRELRAALPEDALVSCDVGYNKAVSAQCWPAYRPRTFFVSNGLPSMGYGLPAALALKLADRTRPVACVLGDGGFCHDDGRDRNRHQARIGSHHSRARGRCPLADQSRSGAKGLPDHGHDIRSDRLSEAWRGVRDRGSDSEHGRGMSRRVPADAAGSSHPHRGAD